MSPRRILVTAALPYASGHIHLGHLVEYIQTDIWVRFQKLRGHRCVYICADDTHGTGIMILARQQGRSEEALIAEMRQAHLRDFGGFDVQFDNYGSTHSPQNRALAQEFWTALRRAGLVVERQVDRLYDPKERMFLPDRFVKGRCPKCSAPDQYGDNCEKCFATYSAMDLIDPLSTISGARPEVRASTQLFVQIEQLHGFLEEWTQRSGALQDEVANYLAGHFLGEPLRDWDVSRPAPYFGFEIPDSPGNFWYVWFDAPIGYIASSHQWCQAHGERLDDWWRSPQTEVHHFIGKDISYFHTLFWPVMLRTAGFSLPTKVHIHGFLTVRGGKMSKRDGTFVLGRKYLEFLDPACLRYYYATKLGPRLDDLDLNVEDFCGRVNADLVGKVVNLASRTAAFVREPGLSATYPADGGLFQRAAAAADEIAAAYESCDYNRAMRLVMALADPANKFVEDAAPWNLRKEASRARELQDACTVALNLFRQLAVYLAPVLPRLAEQTGKLLNDSLTSWDQAQRPLVGTRVERFAHMLKRVEPRQVEAMFQASREGPPAPSPSPSTGEGRGGGRVTAVSAGTPHPNPLPGGEGTPDRVAVLLDGPEPLTAEPLGPTIAFDDFARLDLRVVRVVAAEEVKDSKKLLRLVLSLGGDEWRTVLAGIKGVYTPDSLVGRLVILAANLAPREMKFGTSQGMILAAGPGERDIFLLSPDDGAKPGQRVH